VDGLNQRPRPRENREELGSRDRSASGTWAMPSKTIHAREVHQLTHIDPWFLAQFKEIVDLEMDLDERRLAELDAQTLRMLKRKGFSDRRLAYLVNASEAEVRAARHRFGIRPVYKRVDTCAAEFATRTAYITRPTRRNARPCPPSARK